MKTSKKANRTTIVIMVLLVIIIILLACLLIFWKKLITPEEQQEPINNVIDYDRHENVPSDAIKWDFDGDGGAEYMWLTTYVDNQREEWICYIHFSKNTIPTISLEWCIWWTPVNEWDLDWDWTDEIWLMPEWFTSCWRAYNVWTFKNKSWTWLISPISTHCIQQEECYDKTWKDCDWISTGFEKGRLEIYSSIFTDDWIFWKTDYIEL